MYNIKRSVLIAVYVGVGYEFCLLEGYPNQILPLGECSALFIVLQHCLAFFQCSLYLGNILCMPVFCSIAADFSKKWMVGCLLVYIFFSCFAFFNNKNLKTLFCQVVIEVRQKLFKRKKRD